MLDKNIFVVLIKDEPYVFIGKPKDLTHVAYTGTVTWKEVAPVEPMKGQEELPLDSD